MRIKLDENLPESLAKLMTGYGHDADTVLFEKLKGAPDDLVWKTAQNEHRFFITQDLDFSDVRLFRPGNHAGAMLIRLHNPSAKSLIERLTSILKYENVESWKQCFVVVTDYKIRVLKTHVITGEQHPRTRRRKRMGNRRRKTRARDRTQGRGGYCGLRIMCEIKIGESP